MSNARKLAANLPTEGSLSGRNVIINGNFEIAQRGTSQTAAGYGTLDRFVMSLSGATATMTQESFTIGQTDVVGSHKFLKLAVSTGNNYSGVYYKVEAQHAIPFVGKKVTLTYYAKGTSPAAGLQVAIGWYDGSNSSSYASTTVTLTSTWTKYTHTFDVPSINGITLTNVNAYLEVKWAQADTDTGTGAYEVNLAQTQLEVGSQSTPFEHEPVGVTLSKCQRYFYKEATVSTDTGGKLGVASGSSTIVIDHSLPVQMRAKPSVSLTTQNLRCGDTVAQGFTTTSGTVSLNTYSGSASVTYILGGFSGLTSYRIYLHEPDGASTGTVQFDAEL